MTLKADMRILVVDDMATMRKIIKNMLTQIGFTNIQEADDGSTAWKKMEDAIASGAPYEFIVSDWNMPQLSGLDFLKKIRSVESLKNLPFLMITAEAEQGNVVIAVKAGVSNFIVKPFSAQVLKEKIDKIFNK
ncbi:MAG: histidine kinase [Bdellovibrionales bacterium RIFOXYD12_FULL_39_22]|nr:MAG: histidine kinase [Bdellovibrionales bacterium RIFOXYB1_FULL_39_21]OFZ45027.1 MAG: histidine kinase [Bdellovibrionales bacterium RIFOXYC12_FULL_39_17]OFZ49465.1 MAG: histidine kinase [Bdellovibrionales bacterium RIFOXYC1_FULL_39_130]OFZ72861.1 MAG: histidine kinase [Bdellovibrionales bacterium RIFOXYC2_FULL_39_8]OFZ77204.1 MAG: histidine kinase [Bdellovibrionales bacterium RIFOXYD1_FULL_39_84]OFZ95649.1 MAG: histidine kinase [Bdellovibrionales bacterium RIFOXYD12_FULL_39_22]HLE11163.1 